MFMHCTITNMHILIFNRFKFYEINTKFLLYFFSIFKLIFHHFNIIFKKKPRTKVLIYIFSKIAIIMHF